MLNADLIHQQINALSIAQEIDLEMVEAAHAVLRQVGYNPYDLSMNLLAERSYPRNLDADTLAQATNLVILACGTLNLNWTQD